MKIKSLLVMTASMLMSVSAFGQWTKPAAPELQDFIQDGETEQYIYNVEAGAFLLGANDWNTRGSVSTSKGYKWKVTVTGEGTVSLTDQVETKSNAWLKMFVESNSSIWVDNNTGLNCDTWVLTPLGDHKYNISNVAFPDELLGTDVTGVDTRVYLTSWFGTQEKPIEAVYTWASVSPEAYDAWVAAAVIYDKAVTLGDAIKAAEEEYPGIDLSAQKAVYGNTESTAEQLNEAINAIPAVIKQYVLDNLDKATLANPIDISELVEPCNIDNLTGDPINKGFTREFIGQGEIGSIRKNTWSNEGVSDGTNMLTPFIENWVGKGSSLSDQICHSDTVTLKPGAYRITARVRLYNEGGAETIEGASLFGNMQKKSIIAPDAAPSADISTGENGYFTYNGMLGYYNPEAESYAVVGNDGKLTFGIEVIGANYNWQAHKDYKVYYLGASDESVLKARNEGEIRETGFGEGALMTKTIKEDIEATVKAYAEATTAADIMAALTKYNEQIADPAINENIAAWAAYKAEGEKANKLIQDPKYASIAVDLADYLSNEYGWNLEDLELTTEQVIAETKKLNDLYEEAKALTPEGTDVSSMLTNPDFAKGWDGWSHSGTGGNVAANSGAKCAEAWNSANFDIHQDIENAPVGAYEIQVQGFYRYMRGDNAWLAYFNEDGTKRTDPNEFIKDTPARIYCNANTTAMANVFDYGVAVEDNYYTGDFYTDPNGGFTYPNNMADAGLAFDRGAYSVSTFGLVSKKGDPLRVGIKGNSNQEGDSWAIFTRFKLIYQGYKADVIKPELEKNLNAELGDQKMSAATKEAYNKAVEAGKTALTSGDGKAMFDALSAIFDQKEAAENSAKVYAELSAKLDELAEVFESGNSAYRDEATMLWIEASGKVENGEFTDEEAAETVEKVANVIKKLAIPEEANSATEENPCDMTALITNASFETGNTTGWTNDGTQAMGAQSNTAFGKTGTYYCEKWHAAGTLDLNQTLTVLPAGKYVLQADIHCSTGDGVLYANNEQTPVTNTEDATVPGTDQVTVVIAENEPLKFGIKATLTGSTWCCVDNFQLFYLGSAGDGIANISNQTTSKTAIYSINGTQISKFQKGINIIRVNGKAAKYIVK